MPYAHQLLSHVLWSVLHDLGLVRLPFRLREDAPQNCLRNGLAVEEVSELVVLCFLPYSHQLLSHVVWSVLHNIELAQIPPHSVEMLHKTVYEMVQPLWRYVNLYF